MGKAAQLTVDEPGDFGTMFLDYGGRTLSEFSGANM